MRLWTTTSETSGAWGGAAAPRGRVNGTRNGDGRSGDGRVWPYEGLAVRLACRRGGRRVRDASEGDEVGSERRGAGPGLGVQG